MKKYLLKVLRKLGFDTCYCCGKLVFLPYKRGLTWRFVESPKDTLGIKAPVCRNHYDWCEAHQWDN